jgi:DNA-directed RNA polymerase specialized sigma24 family protein
VQHDTAHVQERDIAPLTHVARSTGEVYRREPEVERQIHEALALPPAQLAERAAAREDDPGYLNAETLAYLVRHFRRAGDERTVNDLTGVLVRRIESYVARRLYHVGTALLEECRDQVVYRLFERLLDFESDRGDFLQVRFWAFLTRIITDVASSYSGLRDQMASSVSPAWVHGGELSEGEREDGMGYVPEPASGDQVDTGLLVREALGTLEDPYRAVFVLRYYVGMPVESKHPGEPTISGHFGVTSRTVRNWLTTAEKRLAEWREERI